MVQNRRPSVKFDHMIEHMGEPQSLAAPAMSAAEAKARNLLGHFRCPVLVYRPGVPEPVCHELPEDPGNDLVFLRSTIGTDRLSNLSIGRGVLLYYAAEPAADAEENSAAFAVARCTGGGLRTPPRGSVVVTRFDGTHVLAPLELRHLLIVLDAEARNAARGPAPAGRSWVRNSRGR
jgi:hypothetical protein